MTHVGNIDRGQPPRFEREDGEPVETPLDVHRPEGLTTEDLETIQREVVAGLDKRQSQVDMVGEASDAWDAIAAEVTANAGVSVWELPLEVPSISTDITPVAE